MSDKPVPEEAFVAASGGNEKKVSDEVDNPLEHISFRDLQEVFNSCANTDGANAGLVEGSDGKYYNYEDIEQKMHRVLAREDPLNSITRGGEGAPLRAIASEILDYQEKMLERIRKDSEADIFSQCASLEQLIEALEVLKFPLRGSTGNHETSELISLVRELINKPGLDLGDAVWRLHTNTGQFRSNLRRLYESESS